MKKIFLLFVILISVVAAFWIGRKTMNCECNAVDINEIHFVNPKYFQLNEPSFQSLMANMLRDTLKKIKPPFEIQVINHIIDNIEHQTKLNNYIKVININQSNYKILVSSNDMDLRSAYLLVTKDSVYYMKPLKIIKDLPLPLPKTSWF